MNWFSKRSGATNNVPEIKVGMSKAEAIELGGDSLRRLPLSAGPDFEEYLYESNGEQWWVVIRCDEVTSVRKKN